MSDFIDSDPSDPNSRRVVKVFTRNVREQLLSHPRAKVARKRSRTVVVKIDSPFTVDTEHGNVIANAGDYLATNHPDDDPSSDVWPVSAERFNRSYKEIEAS